MRWGGLSCCPLHGTSIYQTSGWCFSRALITPMWSESVCPANQHPKSTIRRKSQQTFAHLVNVSAMFDNHKILLFWSSNKRTFYMFSLRDLRLVLCSRDLGVLRAQRIRLFFILITHVRVAWLLCDILMVLIRCCSLTHSTLSLQLKTIRLRWNWGTTTRWVTTKHPQHVRSGQCFFLKAFHQL